VDHWASAPTGKTDLTVARAIRRAVDRAARTLPGSDCLPQALTAELMLRRAGLPTRVSIGVASDGQLLSAHAWVESAGFLVTGDSTDLDQFRTLVVYGSESRATEAP
jgi:transglutaminase-like putative cysteine protease